MNGIHPKVKAAALGALLVSIVLGVLVGLQNDPDVFGSAPAWVQALLVIVIPPLITFLAGYAQPGPVPPPASLPPLPPLGE